MKKRDRGGWRWRSGVYRRPAAEGREGKRRGDDEWEEESKR